MQHSRRYKMKSDPSGCVCEESEARTTSRQCSDHETLSLAGVRQHARTKLLAQGVAMFWGFGSIHMFVTGVSQHAERSR